MAPLYHCGGSPVFGKNYGVALFALLGDPAVAVTMRSPDGSLATTTYDDLGRAIQQQDPDRGTSTASYDPNGNVIQTVDARGAAGAVYYGYDGLNRLLWRNSSNTSNGAWVTYTYDSTANGNMGMGHVTGEQFSGPANLSGSYSYTYDARGRQVAETITVNGTSYTVQASYNDAGLLTSQTYPDGEVVTPGYDANGWLIGLTTTQNNTTTVLASAIQYQGNAGAAGKATAMLLGNSRYSFARSFDAGLRVTSLVYKNQSSGAVLYQEQPQYDAANNVVAATTTMPTGDTDVQDFCYDALNRLTWAGASGTPPCGSTLNAGTLTAAQYQQGYSYDAEGRLTTGPAGSYTYGDSAHPHAVTNTSSGFSASYDAAGNMICRAPNSSVTCGGSAPTGQQLSYDAEGRLVHWQNMPTAPSSSVDYLYDGEGNRVVQQATVGGSTTTTIYLGQLEEIQQSASGTQTLTYYSLGGAPVAEGVNGSYYYFGYDVLGSLVVALDSGGNVAGTQLYGPYGNQRYTTGSLPTSLGYTGQRADSVTGLDYYVARYYDPMVGQFLTADTVQESKQGQDPYVYVGGNPETRTDPTGQMEALPGGGGGSRVPAPAPVVDVDQAGACNSKTCYQPHGTEILRSRGGEVQWSQAHTSKSDQRRRCSCAEEEPCAVGAAHPGRRQPLWPQTEEAVSCLARLSRRKGENWRR